MNLKSPGLAGPWFQAAGGQRPDWDKYRIPPKVRHGSMIPISRTEYDTLVTAFDRTPVSVKPSRSD